MAFRSTLGDGATARVQWSLNESDRAHVSSATINGRLRVRLTFLSRRTSVDVADETLDLIASAVTGQAV